MTKGKILTLVLIFLISLTLVVLGQKTVGYPYLAMQIVGLIGILYVVHCYNKQYK